MSVIPAFSSNYSHIQSNLNSEVVVASDFCATHPMPSSLFRPFQPLAEKDSFGRAMGFLTLEELGRVACVSRVWRYESEAAHIWKKSCETNQFPLVVNRNGGLRNHKQDVRVLYPITISGSKISKYFGKVVGKAGEISEEVFARLSMRDPFQLSKFVRDTFRFVCDFSFIERERESVAKNLLILDMEGNLDFAENFDSDDNAMTNYPIGAIVKSTQIPFSVSNMLVIFEFPLAGREDTCAFSDDEMENDLYKECDTCAPVNSVYFMRREVVAETIDQGVEEQENIVKVGGVSMGAPELNLTPLRIRVLANAIDLIESGTCADVETAERKILVRYSDESLFERVFGGVRSKRSQCDPIDRGIYSTYDPEEDSVGVVPGGPAKPYRPAPPEQQAKAAEKAQGEKRSRSTNPREQEERKVEAKRE